MKKTLMLATVLASFTHAVAPAMAAENNYDWLVRLRGIAVAPQDDDNLSAATTDTSISTTVVPELDLSYFFTPNIAVEAIAGITPHQVTAKGGVNADLGDIWLLPPTVTLQYHFLNDSAFTPYVGAGLNYTLFFDQKDGSSGLDVNYKPSFGPALQVGFDYAVDDRWVINADIKKIWITTDVNVGNGTITGDVDINPWVIGAGVGYRF